MCTVRVQCTVSPESGKFASVEAASVRVGSTTVRFGAAATLASRSFWSASRLSPAHAVFVRMSPPLTDVLFRTLAW